LWRLLELHGDRGFKDDKAMIGGLGKMVVNLYDCWSTKGYNTKTRQYRNFGMANQKDIETLRLMKMAEKFGIPVLTLIDTQVLIQGWKRKNADKVSYRQKYI
jgi:acetyl-CoA carboxylase carboxyl transferase subunit alpha